MTGKQEHREDSEHEEQKSGEQIAHQTAENIVGYGADAASAATFCKEPRDTENECRTAEIMAE